MSRRPVNELAKSRDPVTRQELWDVMVRQSGWFTIADLFNATYMPRRTIRSYLGCLLAGDMVERDTSGSPHLYQLIEHPVEAPRLSRDGQKVKQGQGTENLWRSMRMLAEFSSRDLAAHSTTDRVGVSEATAKAYCSMLHRTGYLRITHKAVPTRSQAVYRLVRNSGPKPPQIQRIKQVFDPNTGEVYHPERQS